MTEAQAAFTPTPDKRTHDQVKASPSTEPPPSSRSRHDSTDFDFVDQFLTAVSDPRVVSSLVKTLLKPMLAELKQKDEKLEQLTAEVQELKKKVHVLKTASTLPGTRGAQSGPFQALLEVITSHISAPLPPLLTVSHKPNVFHLLLRSILKLNCSFHNNNTNIALI